MGSSTHLLPQTLLQYYNNVIVINYGAGNKQLKVASTKMAAAMVHVAGCTKIAYILSHYLISEHSGHIIKIYSFVKNLQLFSNLSSMNDNSKPLTKDSSTESAEFYSTQDLEEGNLISVSGKTILNNHSGNGNVITEQPLGNKCNEQPTSSVNLFNIVK